MQARGKSTAYNNARPSEQLQTPCPRGGNAMLGTVLRARDTARATFQLGTGVT